MNPQSHTPSNPLVKPQQLVPIPVDGHATHTAADRLYQIAALTAGLFLLVTLL